VNVVVIGLGYWGPNLVRNFLSTPQVKKVYGFDKEKNRHTIIKSRYPSVEIIEDMEAVFKNKDIDAIAIATPVATHYPLCKKALECGKHVLLEKPMTSSVRHAEELISIAEKNGLVLMVDHTFLYTGAVRKIKEIIESGDIGDIYYFDSVRVNLGLFQHDVNVVWDLAAHDVSIMKYIIKSKVKAVLASGIAHYNNIEDIAYITIFLDDGLIAHFHVNWLAPTKVRKILIGGTKKMIVYDDTEPSEKVKVYDKGIIATNQEGVHRMLISYRTGDMYAPKLDDTEALTLVCKDFVESIINHKNPISDCYLGLDVVKILEASEFSIKNDSIKVRF